MLKIINNLKPFFENCYRKIGVREYAREKKLSPPTASKLLNHYKKLNLLKKEKERNFLFFSANIDSQDFIALSRIYWRNKLSNVTEHLQKELLNPTIILFGSLSKAEATLHSDIDLAIFSPKKNVDLSTFEGKHKRTIQTFFFSSTKDVSDRLLNNILGGEVLCGRIRVQ